ncbi:MAG: carbohydrate binding domain-containing protein [Pseudomonadota bacterium]
MHSDSFMRSVRALGAFVFSAALAGCFGTGDGPESIAGTPAPPPPPSLCDPATAQGDGAPFPIFFENLAAGYDFGMDAGFGGGATVVVENPVCSAENTTPQVARYQKFAAEPFGGSTLQLGTNVDFTPGAAFTVKVWSQRVVPFTFKFEDAISGDPALGIERIESHSGSAEWETLCFDFTGATAGFTTSSITLIFDNGVVGDADNDPDNWTFFLDAIEQVDVCPGAPTTTLPVDFEGDPASFQFANFAGGEADVIANPDQSGSNTTAQTARMRKFADQVFGGSTLSLAGNVDFTQGTAFTMQVWSPRVVPVLFKFEDAITGDPNAGIEATENHPGGSEWQELCFDFGVAANGFTSSAITFIFDGAVVGDAENDPTNWTFYFDEIQQVADCSGGGGTSAPPSIDFESGSFTINDFDGGMSMVGANPETAGLNPSAAALQLQKFPGATFGGSTLQLGGDIDFSNGEIYEVLVYSTRTVDLLFKLEGLNIEATLTHGGTGWELLCYDFSGQTTGTPSSAITFIFDNGTAGAADTDPDNWTFFVDDIEQVASCGGGGGTGALPVLDFESAAGGTGFTWTVFENDDNPGVAFIPNPDQSGINTSATVAEFTARAAGAEFAGAATDDLPTFTLDASTAIVKVKVWKTEISDVGIKYENATQGSTGEIKVANTVVNQWEELTFDFTPVIGNPVNTDITRLVIFPDFQARAQQNVIYFDDLTIGDGSGGGGVPMGELAINGSFESGDLTDWTVFLNDGTATVVSSDATDGTFSVNVVAVTLQNPVLKQDFLAAGTVTTGQTVNISFDMKGSAADGGVIFPELISEGAMGATGEILETIVAPTTDWTTYSYSPTAGADVTMGITFQLAVVCGGAATCSTDVFIDNVSVTLDGGT